MSVDGGDGERLRGRGEKLKCDSFVATLSDIITVEERKINVKYSFFCIHY